MTKPWRPLALAAVLSGIAGGGVATAQTVMVRNASPGSTIEVVVNAAAVGKATVDAAGEAQIELNLPANAGKPQIDADVYVDLCGTIRRVLIVERGQPTPPQGAGCDRRGTLGFFLVRRVSNLVVNMGGSTPTMMLRQGAVNFDPQGPAPLAPSGLVVFGGGGFTQFSDAVAVACGNVTDCSGKDSRLAYAVGVDIWFTRFLAAEASYIKPSKVTATGGGDSFRFDSALDPHIVTFAGKAGVPVGRVRFYGKVGMNYHRAIIETTQTHDEITVPVDGGTRTIPGGTQNFEIRTSGWSWQFGGGMEIWAKPSFAIYGEAGRARLKGTALDDEEGALEDRVNFVLFGARFRIGR